MSMVTESGDVAVPSGALWATVIAPAMADTGESPGRTVVHVARVPSVHVEVGEGQVVMIEWLFDSDSTEAH